jgi:hypothetical protein
MTYPEPEKPEKYGHPSTYPVADDEFVSDAFYRKPLFFIPCIVGIIVTVLVAIVLTASSRKPAVVLPTYDQEVLTFPAGTTDWRLSPETSREWPQYLCQIDNQWHKCFPVFVSPTPVSTK